MVTNNNSKSTEIFIVAYKLTIVLPIKNLYIARIERNDTPNSTLRNDEEDDRKAYIVRKNYLLEIIIPLST